MFGQQQAKREGGSPFGGKAKKPKKVNVPPVNAVLAKLDQALDDADRALEQAKKPKPSQDVCHCFG